MKKLMTCFLVLLCWTAKAQNFEGVMQFAVKMDITDPRMKAQMEAAQNRKSSPEDQEKFKKMQEKMNDPQFKAMMDANPQMKAQMEAALKMTQGGGDISSMMPSGFSIKIKDGNSISKMEGGMMGNVETLYLKDKDQAYMINRDSKTFSALPSSAKTGSTTTPEATVKVTKTTETIKILGYTCTKYNVEMTERGKSITQAIWATTEIKNIDFKKIGKAKVGSGQSFYHEGIDGVPLRVQMTMPQGTMTMEVTELKSQSLPGSDFVIPADFKESQMFGR